MSVNKSLTNAAFRSLKDTEREKFRDGIRPSAKVNELLEGSQDSLFNLEDTDAFLKKRIDNSRATFQYENYRASRTKYQIEKLSVQEMITVRKKKIGFIALKKK